MKILFVCKSNAERSQIAEILLNTYSIRHRASSTGANVDKEGTVGAPAGHIVSELMLSLGHSRILKVKRKQLTRKMVENADRVIVLLQDSEVRAFLPDYVRCNAKTVTWNVGFRSIPRSVYNSFPPHTYRYHLRMLKDIIRNVNNLVEELGDGE
ncbi:MAG: hypothetical protein M1569_00260, partial [Candidatus Marsarchaeota archaeon]|nr:hypothetical protein [Candidatus Marsarchaeota archaeon]